MIVWPKKIHDQLGEIADGIDGDADGSQTDMPEGDESIDGVDAQLGRIAATIGGPISLDDIPPPGGDVPPPPGVPPPPKPNASVPRHQELADILSRFRLDDATAQELGLGATDPVQPPEGVTPWEFPRWHYTAAELGFLEGVGYPYRHDSSRKDPYLAEPAPPLGPGLPPKKAWPPEWELTPDELRKRGYKTLLQRQANNYVAQGWVTPYVKRLSPSDTVVLGAKAARAMLPKVNFATPAQREAARRARAIARQEGKPLPPNELKPMQWVCDAGWMYITPQRDPYIKWLYEQWARAWLEATVHPDLADADAAKQRKARTQMFARLGAMATMFQEATPPSINTYDGCVFSYGIGFAIGAPQIVCEIVKDPNIRKLFYLVGIHITERTLPGQSTKIYDLQMIDLFDERAPLIQVWDYNHHWYGFTRGGDGVKTMAPSGKGFVQGQQPQFPETFTVETDNKQIQGKVGKASDSHFADGPLSSSENYYNAFQRLSNPEGREMEVLGAFIAVAEDELTRATVNAINQQRITNRASVDDSVCQVFTEAGYTFVSMCVHNWAIPVSKPDAKARGEKAIWLGQLLSFLRPKDAAAVRTIRERLGPRPGDPGPVTFPKDAVHNPALVGSGPATVKTLKDATLDGLAGAKQPQTLAEWLAMAQIHDALVAKGLARIVMSLLEWNRYLTAIKECARRMAARENPRLGMWNEQLRSYNWGWRFKRLREYWLRMTTGHNYFTPLLSVVKGSGIDVNELDPDGQPRWPQACILRQAHGVPYTKFADFDIATPHAEAKLIAATDFVATYGNEFGDGHINEFYYDLGPLERFKLPALMGKYGRSFQVLAATVDRYSRPLTATVLVHDIPDPITCDALGKILADGQKPTVTDYEPTWPERPKPAGWMRPLTEGDDPGALETPYKAPGPD